MDKIVVDEDIFLRFTEEIEPKILFELIDSNREYFGEFLNWVSFIKTVEDEKIYTEKLKSDETVVGFSVFYKNKLVALIGFVEIDKINKNAQIGYSLDEKFQGKGIMTKACKKILEYGFNELDLQRIEIRAAVSNQKSKAVIKRLNAVYEGVSRNYYLINGKFLDCEVYSVLKNLENIKPQGKHTMFFKTWKWVATGKFWDENEAETAVIGETNITICENIGIDSFMEIQGENKVRFDNKYAIQPFKGNSANWTSINPAIGNLIGTFTIIEDAIISEYYSEDKNYHGVESLTQLSETKYFARGAFYNKGKRISSWAVELNKGN